jgi:maltose alpha-D-glucosyltransferase/alpha-amylase
VLARPQGTDGVPGVPGAPLEHLAAEPPDVMRELAGLYLPSARLLGRRTAEMHGALASRADDPDFAPEPFSTMYQRSLYQSLRSRAEQSLAALQRHAGGLPQPVRGLARGVVAGRDVLVAALRRVLERKIGGMRVRCHGDFHLGQVLSTGRDFIVVDFEGEPARALGERRIKRSPLTDVAGLLRSLDYAVAAATLDGRIRPEDVERLQPWAAAWKFWVAQQCLGSYLDALAGTAILPKTLAEIGTLLDIYQLEKALYEVTYELNHRPAWTKIPLGHICEFIRANGGGRR